MSKERYTKDTPEERGYYWVKRDSESCDEIVSIGGSKHSVGGCIYVSVSVMVIYHLFEFCDLWPDAVWCGPIDPPGNIQ